MRAPAGRVELSATEDVELEADAVVEDDERDVPVAEVLEEQRLAETPDERLSLREEPVVLVVDNDQSDVDVGVQVGLTADPRTPEEDGEDPVVSLADLDDPVERLVGGRHGPIGTRSPRSSGPSDIGS